MSDEKKSGEELMDEPQFTDYSTNMGETPFNSTMDALLETKGERLEMLCRATRQIAEAASISYNMHFRFRSKYIAGKIEQIERLSVSINGQGRSEIVQSLQAGSGVPGEFYESGQPSSQQFSES